VPASSRYNQMKESAEIIRVTIWGLFVNISLIIIKIAGGLVVGSAALIADGIHSVSDLSTDLVVILGIKLSDRPADEDHAYGHGKYETFAASFVGTALVGVGFYIAARAGVAIYDKQEYFPGFVVLVVALISIASKEVIYRITHKVARRVKSTALYANAWHHRSDALSSVAVLFGGAAGILGWGYGDRVAALVVGLMVATVGLNALWKVFLELCEGSISNEEQSSIAKAIENVPGVKSWHRLRTRLVGRQVFMDVHVQVDAQLSVVESHRICNKVERAINDSVERPVNVVIHCEPDVDPDKEVK